MRGFELEGRACGGGGETEVEGWGCGGGGEGGEEGGDSGEGGAGFEEGVLGGYFCGPVVVGDGELGPGEEVEHTLSLFMCC